MQKATDCDIKPYQVLSQITAAMDLVDTNPVIQLQVHDPAYWL